MALETRYHSFEAMAPESRSPRQEKKYPIEDSPYIHPALRNPRSGALPELWNPATFQPYFSNNIMKRKIILYSTFIVRSQFEHCSQNRHPSSKTMLDSFEAIQKSVYLSCRFYRSTFGRCQFNGRSKLWRNSQ